MVTKQQASEMNLRSFINSKDDPRLMCDITYTNCSIHENMIKMTEDIQISDMKLNKYKFWSYMKYSQQFNGVFIISLSFLIEDAEGCLKHYEEKECNAKVLWSS